MAHLQFTPAIYGRERPASRTHSYGNIVLFCCRAPHAGVYTAPDTILSRRA